MSFFSEPQAYISFMVPLYILLLKKKNIKFAIPVVISFLLSTSSTGILVVAIITFIWGIKYIKNVKYKVGFMAIFILFLVAFYNLDIFQFAQDKILNINVKNNVRISNGFKLFASLPFDDQIIGIGGGNSAHYWGDYLSNDNYSNSFAKILIEYGIIGAVALIIFLISQFRERNEVIQLSIIYIIVAMFGQTILFNSWQLFTFVIMYIYIQEYNKKTEGI